MSFSKEVGDEIKKGEEYGYFSFGGSTCICLFEPNKIQLDSDLLANSARPLETLVRMGTQIGVARS